MSIKIFFCYAHKDKRLLNELRKRLRPLEHQGLIDMWHDANISAGAEWERAISEQLNDAQIILLLVSPDFMDSTYCYGIEMKRAVERHEHGEACVIPVILRPVYWQGAPFSKLQPLPTEGKPVVSPSWHNQGAALFNVAEGIRVVVEEMTKQPVGDLSATPMPVSKPIELESQPPLEILSGCSYERLTVDTPEPTQAKTPHAMPVFAFCKQGLYPDLTLA
jgi:hypothetical protein